MLIARTLVEHLELKYQNTVVQLHIHAYKTKNLKSHEHVYLKKKKTDKLL